MSFKHRLIVGVTGHGKSYKMKLWAKLFLANKATCVVYNPTGDTWPKGCISARSADELEAVLQKLNRARRGAMVFVDEARFLRQQVKPHHEILLNLGSAGRHRGFTVFVASQYPTSIDPNLRWNCSEAYVFRLGTKDQAKEIWEQYGCQDVNGKPAWQVMLELKPREHLVVTSEKVEFRSGR